VIRQRKPGLGKDEAPLTTLRSVRKAKLMTVWGTESWLCQENCAWWKEREPLASDTFLASKSAIGGKFWSAPLLDLEILTVRKA
jgi:hypothetical protein